MAAIIRAAAGLMIALTLAACTPSAQRPEDLAPLVWPPAPAAPRIAFVSAFSRPDDLGIGKGLLRRLADALFGEEEVQLVRPMAVVAVGETIYVADPGAQGVHRFDRKNGAHHLIRMDNDVALPSPVALARGADGEVYVTDSELGRVLVVRPGAKSAAPLALAASLAQPTGIAYEPASGRLFVVDTAEHRVKVFNRDGTLASTFGGRGTENGQFNYPTLLWRARDGRLYVTDAMNFRVQIFDQSGRFAGKFGRLGDGSGDLPRQKGAATDSFGHVYIVDALFHAIQVFDDTGTFLLSVGALGQERGEFWLPTGIFVGEDDHIYVADSYNRRVQVFRYVGSPT
jgi:DNA-binding beta-propeller fold protein YncE